MRSRRIACSRLACAWGCGLLSPSPPSSTSTGRGSTQRAPAPLAPLRGRARFGAAEGGRRPLVKTSPTPRSSTFPQRTRCNSRAVPRRHRDRSSHPHATCIRERGPAPERARSKARRGGPRGGKEPRHRFHPRFCGPRRKTRRPGRGYRGRAAAPCIWLASQLFSQMKSTAGLRSWSVRFPLRACPRKKAAATAPVAVFGGECRAHRERNGARHDRARFRGCPDPVNASNRHGPRARP